MSEHPSLEQIERFLADDLSPEESRGVQRHLFTCPRCEERMIALLPGSLLLDEEDFGEDDGDAALLGDLEVQGGEAAEEAGGAEYGGLLQRVLANARSDMVGRGRRLSHEREDAVDLWREVSELPPDERLAAVQGDSRLHIWGFFELLLELGREAIFEDPKQARALFELALAASDRLPAERYGQGSVEAARARAWAYLANVLRILTDFKAAEAAFEKAEDHLSRSWLDPLDEALILELRSSLRRAQRRFDEAAALLDDAIALYREVNEPHFQGRATINKGLVLLYANDVEGATACLRNGLFLIEPAEEPRLVIVAQQNLICCLNDSGRAREARALIDDARPLWRQVGRRLDLVRLRWVEARVETSLGHFKEAEEALLEVRAAFAEDRIAYDVALVSLDLAALYARQGRTAETKRLAAEMLPIFQSREVHREALAALVFFQRAAEMEQLTLSIVDEISTYLERARDKPDLKFRLSDD